jgi:integrase
MFDLHPFLEHSAANDSSPAVAVRTQQRERTVPIPETLTPVPGYPQKLCVFKIAASRFWQVRCWVAGRTYRRSTQSQSLRMAQSFARQFYEQLMAQHHSGSGGQGQLFPKRAAGKRGAGVGSSVGVGAGAESAAQDDASFELAEAVAASKKTSKPAMTFGALTSQVLANELARSQRGEYALGSYQVLRNRLDAHILPRWGDQPPSVINFLALMAFTQFLSQTFSTTTISQYMVAVRKVLSYAVAIGELDKLPEFPKIKIVTTPRGAFTPSEYWKIIRTARRLSGQQYPASADEIRANYKIRVAEQRMPPDLARAIAFMLNSFIRPSDLKTLKHRHVEIVRANNTYLRLTLPETKSHGRPIVTLQPAVRCYQQICKHQATTGHGAPDDYLFLPALQDRNYAHWVLNFHFNWILAETGLKMGPHGQPRSLYSLRHSSITFRLLYGQGIDLLTLARNARTSVDVINTHYASTVTGEQNIALLQSRRTRVGS